MKSAFFIKRREALHFLRGLSSVFGKKSGGIFKKPDLKAAENKGWRIRETIFCNRRVKMVQTDKVFPMELCLDGRLQDLE